MSTLVQTLLFAGSLSSKLSRLLVWHYAVQAFSHEALSLTSVTLRELTNNNNSPLYEYCPLESTHEEYRSWETKILDKHKDKEWIQNIYWKLDIVSCVLVLRNKEWFKKVKPTIESFWRTIEHEKENGFEHRGPKKRCSPKLTPMDTSKINIDNIEKMDINNLSNKFNNKNKLLIDSSLYMGNDTSELK